nr:polyprotein [Rodent hepacivirus]
MVTKKKAIVAARRRPGPQRSKGVPKSRERGQRLPQKPTAARHPRPKPVRQPRRKEGWLHWWNRKTMSNPIPIVDPVLNWGAWLIAPSSRAWPNDPRHRSRNLGRVIDGVTGWAADVSGHVPLVGRLCRPVVRVGAHIVRGAEDIINVVTSPFGFGLFIICLLSLLPCSEASQHWCPEAQRITNCCSQREISFCTRTMCWHRHGCVPCSADGCWTPVGVTWSVLNASDRFDLWYHLDWVSGIVYTCDTLDIGEWCGAAAVVVELAVDTLQYHHDFVCNLTCFLFVDPLDSTTWFFEFVGTDLVWVRVIWNIIEGAPGLLGDFVTGGLTVSFLVLIAYTIEGKWSRAIMLLLLISYAKASGCTSDSVFIAQEPAEVCPTVNTFRGTALCFTPAPYIVREHHLMPPGARGCIWSKCHTVRTVYHEDQRSGWNLYNPSAGFDYRKFTELFLQALQLWAEQGYPNITSDVKLISADSERSCYFPTRARLSGRCTGWKGNLSAGETWEDCGKGMWLTECAVVWSSLVNQSWHTWPSWFGGKRYFIAVDPSERCKQLNWTLRLPGSPEIKSFNYAYRPHNHHYSTGEAASGYLQFSADGAYQVMAGGTILSPFPYFHDALLLFTFCILVRARYMTFLVAAWLVYTAEGAVVDAFAGPALAAACPPVAIAVRHLQYQGWSLVFLFLLPFFLELGLLPYIFCAWLGYSTFHSPALAAPHFGLPVSCSFYLLVVGLLLSVFPFAKRVRAGWLWSVTYTRERFTLAVETFCRVGRHYQTPLCLISILLPDAALLCYFTIAFITGWIDILLSSIEEFWLKRMSTAEAASLLLRVYDLLGGSGLFVLKWLIRLFGRRGIWLYDHLGEIDPRLRRGLAEAAVWFDPLMLEETEVRYVKDAARKLACGDNVSGLPVVARLGDMVMCGWNSKVHMDGWRLTRPFRVDVSRHTSWFKTLSLALTGRDTRQARGQVAILGTGLKVSMGFGYGGALVTCYHSSRGKSLATPSGPTLPLSINATDDTVVYPLPPGMTSLEPCGCGTSELWCLDRHGGLHRGELKDNVMVLTAPIPLRDMKGASGSPVLCSQGHAVGMLKSVCHVRSTCCKVNFVSVKESTAIRTVVPDTTNSLPPAVPKDYEVRVLHAATGTGKTTKIPMQYVRDGYNVLVLNPSVMTTLSMGPYMLKEYGIAPSIHTGESSRGTGTKLTYCTYGKLTAMDTVLLQWADVVICDECHDINAPTVLGIGHVLQHAEAAGVKLVLLATATPPGCATTKHPLITEVELGTSGQMPYYGKKLEIENYQKGRHLVFFTSKELCETNARLFRSMGVNSVAFYRGVAGSVIPDTGDVVVCATDALMTGYTGDFDSVTDCNLAVIIDLDIDLNPTFSIKLRTVQANAVVRMQRRGRTGRGRPGVYRFVDQGEACSGIVPESVIVEAFDMAYAWYRMQPGDAQSLLEIYGRTPGLPVINSDLETWASVMENMKPNPGLLEKIKLSAENFATLTAMQWELSEKRQAPLPGSEGRWKGGRYKTGKCPLIFHLDCDKNQEWDDSDPFIQGVSACLGLTREELASGWGLLIAGGVTIGAAVLIDATSSLVVVGGIHINQDYINTIPSEVLFDLAGNEAEECGMDLISVKEHFVPMIDKLREQAAALSATLSAYAKGGAEAAVKAAPDAATYVQSTLLTYMTEILAGCSTFLGIATIRNNAPLACVHAFVAGVVSTLPLYVKCLLGLAAGSVAACLTHTKPVCAFVASGVIGAGLAELSLTSVFTSLFTGYAGATAGANVAYTIMDGRLPSLEDLLGLMGGVFNPGAVVAGVVVAIVLKKGIADRSPDWTNRLLAMLARTNVVPPAYFLDTDTLSQKIGKLIRDMTPIQLFHRLVSWLETPDTTPCAGDGLLLSLTRSVYRVLAGLTEWLKSHLPMPNFGMLSCDTPYKGEWAGNGTIQTRCGCGKKVTFRVNGGYVTKAAVPMTCWNYWMGGVPINGSTCFTGTRPAPVKWMYATVLTGWDDWYEVKRLDGQYYLTGVSKDIIEIPTKIPTELAYCDGARAAQHCGEPPVLIRDFAKVNGFDITLPITLEKLAKLGAERVEQIRKEKLEALKPVETKTSEDLTPQNKTKLRGMLTADSLDKCWETQRNSVRASEDHKSFLDATARHNPSNPPLEPYKKGCWCLPGFPCLEHKQDDRVIPTDEEWAEHKAQFDNKWQAAKEAQGVNTPLPSLDRVKALEPGASEEEVEDLRRKIAQGCQKYGKDPEYTKAVDDHWEASKAAALPKPADPPKDDKKSEEPDWDTLHDRVSEKQKELAQDPQKQKEADDAFNAMFAASWEKAQQELAKRGITPGDARPAGSPLIRSTPVVAPKQQTPSVKPVPEDEKPSDGVANGMVDRFLEDVEVENAILVVGKPVPSVSSMAEHGADIFPRIYDPPEKTEEIPMVKLPSSITSGISSVTSWLTSPVRSEASEQAPLVPIEEASSEDESPPEQQSGSTGLTPIGRAKRAFKKLEASVTSACKALVKGDSESEPLRPKGDERAVHLAFENPSYVADDKESTVPSEDPTGFTQPNLQVPSSDDEPDPPPVPAPPEEVDYSDMPPLEESDPEESWTTFSESSRLRLMPETTPKPQRPKRPKKTLLQKVPASVMSKIKWRHSSVGLQESEDGSWETDEEEEAHCTWSYVWNGVPISTRQIGKLAAPVRYLTSGLGRMRQLVYYTSPASAEERKAKVTYWRKGEVDKVLSNVRHKAIVAASKLNEVEVGFAYAADLTPPRSATSCLSGLTAAEVRGLSPKAYKLCMEAYESIGDPTSKYCMVTIMPKVEIFVLTPEKPTQKPARLIAYPPLEMRVAEKMVLGRIAPAAVKAVLGPAYGFQYTPWERVKVLVDWWSKKKRPMGFACDTVCFDSTVTAEDVAFESQVYAAAAAKDVTKARIHGLGSTLYTHSPMYNQEGKLLGVRNCRASGVFTTSSSNCLTAFTKASAAAYHAGLQDVQWLVHGDDIIGICEAAPTNAEDISKLTTFAIWMRKYGCTQGDVVIPRYSLEEITACSSNVSRATDLGTNKPYHFLTRDPVIPLGRAMMEAYDRNAAQTWVGNIILHYPAVWASRVLMVHWLDQIDTLADVPTDIVLDIWGTDYTISVWHLPHLIEKLHGPGARRCAYYTADEIARVQRALKTLGYPPLRSWKLKAKALRVRLLQRGGAFAYLARHFLWFSVSKLPPEINESIFKSLDFKLPSFESPEGYLRRQTTKFKFKVDLLTLLSVLCFMTFVLMAPVHGSGNFGNVGYALALGAG